MRSKKSKRLLLKSLIAKILIRLKLSKFFIIKLRHYKLRFFPTLLSRELWIDSKYLNNVWKLRTNIFWNYLLPGDTVIDIGSHIGTITLESAVKVGESGMVYSIEAHPKIFEYLNVNIKLNNLKNIKTFNVAIGDTNGVVNFSDIHTDPSNAIMMEGDGIKIPIKKLDDLPIFDSEIALIKIYVVGYEKFVLTGAEKILQKTKCVHYTSNISKFEEYGYNYKEVFDFLLKNGFKLFRVRSENEIISISNEYNKKADILAIKNLDDFLQRTNYKIASS